MEMTGPYPHGTPSWVDLMTTDAEAAAAFYPALFGWEVAGLGGEEVGGYTMFRLRDRDVAAFAPVSGDEQAAGASSAWQTYVAVDDVEATAARVEPAGGTVLAPPMDVLDFGRMAVIADPSGAALGLWQAGTHIGCGIVNEPGALVWNELATGEPDTAEAFYGAVLGWAFEDSMSLEGGGTYREIRRPGDGAVVAGLMPMVGDAWPPELPAHWMVYFAVEDADATASLAATRGGAVRVPPTDLAVGRFAVLADPSGAAFSVIRMAEDPAG
jgi:predicted enzyme related to lactoylglutathione lyase